MGGTRRTTHNINIIEDDTGCLAAKFKGYARTKEKHEYQSLFQKAHTIRGVTRTDGLEIGCSGLLHLATGGGGPSERNFADVHVLSEKRASLTRTRDDIDDSWRDASSSDELAQEYGLRNYRIRS